MSSSTRYGLALNGKMSALILMSFRCFSRRGCFSAYASRFASVIALKRSFTGASALASISKFSVTLSGSSIASADDITFVAKRAGAGERIGANAAAHGSRASATISFIAWHKTVHKKSGSQP